MPAVDTASSSAVESTTRMEPETPATESGGDGPARQPAKEVDRTKLSAAVFKHLELEQDEGESLLEFAARYAARGAARALQ